MTQTRSSRIPIGSSNNSQLQLSDIRSIPDTRQPKRNRNKPTRNRSLTHRYAPDTQRNATATACIDWNRFRSSSMARRSGLLHFHLRTWAGFKYRSSVSYTYRVVRFFKSTSQSVSQSVIIVLCECDMAGQLSYLSTCLERILFLLTALAATATPRYIRLFSYCFMRIISRLFVLPLLPLLWCPCLRTFSLCFICLRLNWRLVCWMGIAFLVKMDEKFTKT